MEREKLGSRLGFILLSAGCAIGIGNVWKFPYMCGQYGGGAFLLIYIFFLIIMGVPVMSMEFSMGRASQKSPVRIYQELQPKGKKWQWHGYICMLGNYILMMFYTSVAGWMLQYFFKTAKGEFIGKTTEEVSGIFGNMLSDPVTMTIFMAIVVIAGFFICSFSLQGGLERVTKVMMIALLGIMILLAINSVATGSKEGLKFYLVPSMQRIQEAGGLSNVIVGAMNQAFFTLSLGIGAMAIFGSFIDKKQSLLGESVNVAVLDTFVAFSSGLIIFPACFKYGVNPDAGPSLIFITLPNIFKEMPGGRIWGSLFFIFMTFAAFSTVLAVFGNLISCTMDMTGWSKKKSSLINCIAMLVLAMPCILGFNVWSKFMPFGEGSAVLDLEDFIVSNILLPLGSLIFVIFCVSRYGWGWDKYVAEANEGKGIKIKKWMRPYMTYVLPILIIVIFAIGIYDKFFA